MNAAQLIEQLSELPASAPVHILDADGARSEIHDIEPPPDLGPVMRAQLAYDSTADRDLLNSVTIRVKRRR